MAFTLVLVRVASVLAFLPFLGERIAPMAIKALAAVVVAMALFPAVRVEAAPGGWGPEQFVMFVGAEVLFGALIGTCGLMIFKAIRTAGELIGRQMGMALAAMADPIEGVRTTLIGNLFDVVGVLVFFSVGAHRWMLSAMRDSFDQWPLGAYLAPGFIRRLSVASVSRSFAMAFQLAAPLLLLTFLVSLLMAVMARLVPEMNILLVGFAVRIGVGLIGLALFVPLLVRYCASASAVVVRVISAAAGGT